MRVDHVPDGDPCKRCDAAASKHRIDHIFKGENELECGRCGYPLAMHRKREATAPRRVSHKAPKVVKPPKVAKPPPLPKPPKEPKEKKKRVYKKRPYKKRPYTGRKRQYIGLDGEGQGRLMHRYVLLAVSDETGKRRRYVENQNGLTTEQCLEFLFNLPKTWSLFTFSFGYDLTKILQDVGERELWFLFRPERRQRFGREAYKGPYPVRWNGWYLNLQGTKFSVAKVPPGVAKRKVKNRVIWDIWKFYQSKFTKACEDWKVGTKEEIERMKLMKDKRAEFDKETPESVREYCLSECRSMAKLARKLDEAHQAVGIKLKNFYGAGSTASGILDLMNVRAFMKECSEEMRDPVAAAFFGGRFDHSHLGVVRRKIWGYDISSAYPYQAYRLPCLHHGEWHWTDKRKDMESARLACIRYGLSDITRSAIEDMAWGPLPFRDRAGSICYPAMSGGGWVWKEEYLAAEKYYPHVYFREAWVYHTDCDCQPFKGISKFYLERLRLGKEGPGIVLKLGPNSVYGKLAQSVGRGVYNNWIWAGNITSSCRAMVIEAVMQSGNPWNVLMIATDGIQSVEPLQLALPEDTGTDVTITALDTGKTTRKPLGGWEQKLVEKGVFYARPGVYFPLDPTEDELETVRGRGVGRGVVLQNWERIVDTYDRWLKRQQGIFPSAEDEADEYRWPVVKVTNVSRFCGAKSSISRSQDKQGKWMYNRATGDHLAEKPLPRYGEWVTREVSLSFNPKPKRAGLHEDGRRLIVRDMGAQESQPYRKATLSPEARELQLMNQEMMEQPEVDYADYETDY